MKKSQLKERQNQTLKNIQKEIGVCIETKPLSVNECWRGRRFKTKKYEAYEKEICALLPRKNSIEGDMEISYVFFLQHPYKADLDNFIKPLNDILQKRGYFKNDNRIMRIEASKIKSQKNKISIVIKLLKNL